MQQPRNPALVLGRVSKDSRVALRAAGSTSTPILPLAALGRQCRSRRDNHQGNHKARARLVHGIFSGRGLPTFCVQLLHGGAFLPVCGGHVLVQWHPHGSRSNSSWQCFSTAVASVRVQILEGGAFFAAVASHGSRCTSSWRHLFYRGGIPTVRG